jgi:hypothetical protein
VLTMKVTLNERGTAWVHVRDIVTMNELYQFKSIALLSFVA